MGFSFHIPLWFGLLKIKSEHRLRREEVKRLMPVWRLGSLYFVWNKATKTQSQ